jgi:Secretion system C-terminal sorting domain
LANLQSLFCYSNLLPSLNVQGLTNLMYLNCSNNQLPTLNVQGLINLRSLECASNQLPTLNVQGLPQLQALNCSYNPMPTINVQGLTNLYWLSCDGNEIPNLNVQGLNLSYLSCSNNKLTNLNVQGLPLRNLYCTDNQLTTLNLQGLDLRTLYCTNNQLTSLNLDSIPYLWVASCANNKLTSLTLPSVPYLNELNISKNPITSLTMQDNRNLQYLYCHNTQLSCLPMLYDSLRLLLIDSTNITCLPNQPPLLVKTLPLCQPNNEKGCPFSARLYGTAFHDTNQNCTLDSTADAFSENIVIGVRNIVTQDSFKLNCAANGFYEIALPSPATYEVRIVNNSNYWQTCTTQMVTMPNDSAQIEANIGMRAVVPCADMSINHQLTNIVRPCSTAVYKIACFNAGTIDAIGTVVSVQLPPELSVLSATRPYLRASNNTFRVALPNVKPLARDTFSFSVAVACSAVMGQMLCTEVKVSPHTYCNTDSKDWDGSDITLSGRCIGNDSIRFVLRNTGQGGMTTGRNYTVIEDNIMIRGNSFQLSPNAADSITISADPQKIYRIIADEAPNNPSGAIHETVMVWGCGGITPQIHWGFVNQFGLNNGVSNPHQLCSQVRTSYDPNDISAVAEGIGEAHYILKDTDLEYKIRFQNTGNDTAFVVVVTDTLPAQLDMRTFRIGVASHPFTWSADSDRTLRFTFKNILLVDSMTNEPKSHGFITYRVKTQPNLSVGTTINNQAHIYFDANKPIHTNIYTHTIGENLSKMLLTAIKIIDTDYTVSVAPNPMGDYTKINLNSKNNTLDTQNIDFTLYNVLGQTIKNERFTNQNIILNRSDLAQGIYFYTINEGNKRIAQGKLVVP